MLSGALTPFILLIVMWLNVLYETIVGGVIPKWEWILIFTYTVIVIAYSGYQFRKE
jgi:hypothetical protein